MLGKLIQIEEKLKKIMVDHFEIAESPESIDSEKEFLLDDYGVNSIDILELLLKIEMEFGIEIEDEDLEADLLITLRNLAKYICKKIA